MKKLLLTMALLSSTTAWAELKTVTLEVPSMNCVTCPVTVKLALKKVEGVKTVEATYEPNEAIVTFDDTKTNTKELMAATENAGYPSNVKSSD